MALHTSQKTLGRDQHSGKVVRCAQKEKSNLSHMKEAKRVLWDYRRRYSKKEKYPFHKKIVKIY